VSDNAEGKRSYGAGARILSVGIAATGLVTFGYFALASHALDPVDYKGVSLLWSVMFVIVSVIYRPIEQLLSRTIADRRARGLHHGHPLRVPGLIQLGFALVFLAVALPLHDTLVHDVFDGSSTLYWVLIAGVLAYAASYFARGYLAGHERFGLYGGLVLLESLSRFLFALAVTVGIASGQSAVALGIAAAPFVSLVVVPAAFSRRSATGDPHTPATDAAIAQGPAAADAEEAAGDLSLRGGGRFAGAVFGIQLAEQSLLNAAVIVVAATSTDRALAGFVFNVLLIARAPLQLFQAIQTSLLPHLTGLEASDDAGSFGKTIRLTVLVIAGFAGLVALGLLVVGPFAMKVLFGHHGHYERIGLAAVGLGMGFHLVAGTLNQAALARGRAGLAAGAWLLCAALFVGWVASSFMADPVRRVEAGYLGATLLLSGMLWALYRRPGAADERPVEVAQASRTRRLPARRRRGATR
jgi:O-antigen/teichoic acid export membrane protein